MRTVRMVVDVLVDDKFNAQGFMFEHGDEQRLVISDTKCPHEVKLPVMSINSIFAVKDNA